MRVALTALLWLFAAPGVAHAQSVLSCTGDASTAQPLTLTVDGASATGRYVAPAAPPSVAVVFGHGYGYASDGWVPHMRRVASRSRALAVTMDYRGLVDLGDDPDDPWPYNRSRGYPVKAGSEDLVAAAQAAVARCPSVRHVILLGVSMGGNATGMAMALKAKRPDGAPLFDYWVGVEGVYNLIELYEAANAGQAISPFVAQVKEDIELETGGTPQTQPAAYQERTVVERADDIAASGVKGVVLVHAREDGLALYPQAQELARLLRGGGVPTDFYTVGSRAEGDDPDTTLAGYAGAETGQAGHGSEVSEHHVVIDQGLDRVDALIAGEPPPCGRDFAVEGTPRGVSPDPAAPAAGCPAGTPLVPAATPAPSARCAIRAPRLKKLRARRRGRTVRVTGRVRPGACRRDGARLRVRVRAAGRHRAVRLARPGRFAVRLRHAARARRVRVVASDRGHRTRRSARVR